MSYTVGQAAALDFDPITDVRTGEPVDPLPSNIRLHARSPDTDAAAIEYVYPDDPELNYDEDTNTFHVNLPLDTAGVWEGELSWGTSDGIGEASFRLYVFDEIGYRPTVDDVAARVYARALDENGNRGTFSTDPSPDQVDTLIDDAVAIVAATIGGVEIAKTHWPAATYAVICRVAMAIERGFVPENTDSGDSAYAAWLGEYNAAINALTIGLNADQPNRPRYVSIPIVAPGVLNIDRTTLDLL